MEMVSLVLFLLVSLGLSVIISGAAWALSEKSPNSEKLSPYECGFDPFNQVGNPISVSFFLVAILFLMFDLEVTLLLPWAMNWPTSLWFSQLWAWLFILLLAWGLVYEWLAGGLEWE